MKSFQLKSNAASHSERGLAYKPGEVVRTDRDLIKLHPAKFIEVGNVPDTHWPEDVPYKDNGDNLYYAVAEGDTFRVMQGTEVSRRGLAKEKAFQLVRNWNNGKKHVAHSTDEEAPTQKSAPKASAPVEQDDDADDADDAEDDEESESDRKARLKAEKKAKKNKKPVTDDDEE